MTYAIPLARPMEGFALCNTEVHNVVAHGLIVETDEDGDRCRYIVTSDESGFEPFTADGLFHDRDGATAYAEQINARRARQGGIKICSK